MTIAVTDVRSGAEHQINEAARTLGKGAQRIAIFREIHSGKRRIKTATEIAMAVKLPRKRVLEEAIKFVHKQIVALTKRDGEIAYERDNFYYVNRELIIRRALGPNIRNTAKVQSAAALPKRTRMRKLTRSRFARNRSTPRARRPSRYDIFLSHAWEDKKSVARPLFRALTKKGISVWFDEGTLTIGDSLREKIDEGLAHCRFGVVLLSPRFFAKDWPRRELDGMVAREDASGGKVILPIWHRVTKLQVTRFSPILAMRLAENTKNGIPALVRSIQQVLDS